MTREKAIEILNRDDESMRKGYFCINDFKAIEVLKSEESILCKIRAEIESASHGKWYVGRIDGKTEEVLLLDEVLQIIDKYREG